MKILVKPEFDLPINEQLLEAQVETCGIYCSTLCLCVTKDGWYADDDTEDILF